MKVKKCVGCGFCCISAPCIAADRLYPGAKICPQLNWSDENNRYYCGLMDIPGLVGLSYKKELYAGEGCCSNLNTWRQDVKNRHPKKETNFLTIDPMFQLYLKSLGEEFISGDKITLTINSFIHNLIKHMGMNQAEAIKNGELVDSYIRSNRSTFMEEFMG